jgi:large subunit ribosomal protein L25
LLSSTPGVAGEPEVLAKGKETAGAEGAEPAKAGAAAAADAKGGEKKEAAAQKAEKKEAEKKK